MWVFETNRCNLTADILNEIQLIMKRQISPTQWVIKDFEIGLNFLKKFGWTLENQLLDEECREIYNKEGLKGICYYDTPIGIIYLSEWIMPSHDKYCPFIRYKKYQKDQTQCSGQYLDCINEKERLLEFYGLN